VIYKSKNQKSKCGHFPSFLNKLKLKIHTLFQPQKGVLLVDI
jgi:hypothetical protein